MNQIEAFEAKLRDELCRWGGQVEVVERDDDHGRYRVYTRDHCYAIVVKAETNDYPGYLGCRVSTRAPRAGEDWTRGNDLRDGRFDDKTWHGILCDILAFEMVPVTADRVVLNPNARTLDMVEHINIAGPPVGEA